MVTINTEKSLGYFGIYFCVISIVLLSALISL